MLTPIVFLNTALVGAFAFAGIHHFYLWRTSRRARALLLVAFYSVFSALQMVGVALLGSTNDLGLAQAALDARTTFGLAATVTLSWLIAELTHFRPRKFLVPLTVLLSAGVVINLMVSITGKAAGFIDVAMPWGETVQIVERRDGYPAIAVPLYAGVLALYSFAAAAGIRWAKTDRTSGTLTAIAGATGVLVAIFALMIDLEIVRSPYIGQLANGLWILLATILLSREHAMREEQLAKSEARLAAVIANSPGVAVQRFDERGRVLLWNHASEQLFGISEAEAMGRTLDQLFYPPDQFAAFLGSLASIRRTGPLGPMEFTFQRGAETRVCVSTVFEIPGDAGSPSFVCMDVDITERKRAETALVISEARYRTLIESAPEAVVVLDADTKRIVDMNPEACRMFATTSEAMRLVSPIEISPPLQPDGRESAVAATEYIQAAVAGGSPVFEWMHRSRDGRDFPTEVRLVRLPDPDRVLVRGSVTDISERRKLEEQLLQSQKMEAIGQLAGGVAHDFNNLLTVISGYAEILLGRLPSGDHNVPLVKAISDATERAAWLTARLLAFGRRAVMAPQVFDLNALVGDGERILRRLIGEHIGLRVDVAPAPLNVKLDPGQWSQVMLNLAINARDAMPAGGLLTIRTFSQLADAAFLATHPGLAAGDYAGFSVTDTGLGMVPDVRAHIFEPFFTTKELGKGTGLGLAVVHGIVTQAGGCIDVDTSPGAGTTFTVYLPAVETAPAVPGVTTRGRDHGAGESILVVEDETVLRELLEVALTAHGFKVSTASDGDEALGVMETLGSTLDLLVTDMVMPGRLNGRDLADAVRRRLPQVKVLFISGYIDDPAIRDSGFGHDEPCLQKPFSLAAIAQKARDTLDGK